MKISPVYAFRFTEFSGIFTFVPQPPASTGDSRAGQGDQGLRGCTGLEQSLGSRLGLITLTPHGLSYTHMRKADIRAWCEPLWRGCIVCFFCNDVFNNCKCSVLSHF